MPAGRAELESRVNPESGFDTSVLAVSVLAWTCIVLAVVLRIIPPAVEPDSDVAERLAALGICGLPLIGIGFVLIRALRIAHSWRVISAALLAVFGGPAITCVFLVLSIVLAEMLHTLGLYFLDMTQVVTVVGTLVGSYWSGYRFGIWGPAWGAVSALTSAALCLLASEDVTLRAMVFADVPAVALGALAGWAGAAHCQRLLLKDSAKDGSAASRDDGS